MKGYKQHLKNIHEGKYNYKCSLREFQTDGKQLYAQHMVKSHKKDVSEKEKKRLVCYKCGKKFPGHQLMKAHLKKTECSTKFKNFQCGDCKKWLKTRASLEQHKKVYHPPGSRRYKCSRCNAELGSSSAFYNHLMHHRGLDVDVITSECCLAWICLVAWFSFVLSLPVINYEPAIFTYSYIRQLIILVRQLIYN